MKRSQRKNAAKNERWILFLYSVPSKPVSNRMKVWRKLMKAGAVQLKGSVYVLPYSDEHYEFLQWLVTEVSGMKGEAAIARIEKIDTMEDSEIVALFNRQRAHDYAAIERALDDLERRLGSIQKGEKTQLVKGISGQFTKIFRDFEEVRRIDFFSSKEGERLTAKIKRLRAAIETFSGAKPGSEKPAAILTRKLADYYGRTWVTRKKPFVDRMASAWLIRKFIDRKAVFGFIDEEDTSVAGKNSVVFDMRGGEFTHSGDMCTFEILLKSFGLTDKALRKVAQIVHELDVKDDKFKSAEAKGLEDILIGIRKTAKDDREALEKGIQVFEMLHASRT